MNLEDDDDLEVANDNDPDAPRPMTHREIAEALGLSKSRVQQIEATAMRKLKRALAARGGW